MMNKYPSLTINKGPFETAIDNITPLSELNKGALEAEMMIAVLKAAAKPEPIYIPITEEMKTKMKPKTIKVFNTINDYFDYFCGTEPVKTFDELLAEGKTFKKINNIMKGRKT